MMDNLTELSYNEMLRIEGGDWLKNFGAWCHKQYCALTDAISNYEWTDQQVQMSETLMNCI
jgi:hypothetical protein